MGIALLALSGLIKNLHSLTTSPPSQASPQRQAVRLHPEWAVRSTPCAIASHNKTQVTQGQPRLRVVHVRESDHGAVGAGRIVISGRMADVCAELDRLVAIEARQRST